MKKDKKKRLSNFDFNYNGAAVALVGDFQGGPANGYTTLLTKAVNDIDQEEINKALEQNSLPGESSANVNTCVNKDTSPENDPNNPKGDTMDINEILESDEGKAAITKAAEAAAETAVEAVKGSYESKITSLEEVIKGFQDEKEAREKGDLLVKAKEVGIKEEDLEKTVNDWYEAKKAGFGHIVDESITRHLEAKKSLEDSDLFNDIDTREISDEEKEKEKMMKAEINKTRNIQESA